MRIPNDKDWKSEPWCFDTEYAYDHFFGKSLGEAFDLFVSNAIIYQEDIMFMPKRCFTFYAYAYMDYLKSDNSNGDPDGASCFFGIVECRKPDILENEKVASTVIDTLEHISTRQKLYDADIDIYGDFNTKANRLIKQLNNRR